MKRGPRMLDATAHFEAVHERLPGGAKVLQARRAALARAEQTGDGHRDHPAFKALEAKYSNLNTPKNI